MLNSSSDINQTNSRSWSTRVLASARDGAAGASSAVFTSILLQPLDVIRTRQQLHPNDSQHKYRTIFRAVATLYQEEGVTAFWRGTGPTIWRVLPGGGLYFGLLSLLSESLKTDKDNRLSPWAAACAGAISRATAGTLLHPVSVVKTRFEAFDQRGQRRTTIGTLIEIGKSDGMKGLFRGLGPTLMRDVPYSSLNYGIYTNIKERLEGVPDSARYFIASTISGFTSTLITHPFDLMRTRLQTNRTYTSSIDVIKHVLAEEGMRTLGRGFWPRLLRRTLSSAATWTSFEDVVVFLEKNVFKRVPSE
eukprot:TRINITY_DN15440_c0_g1_i1.p1 TRINITY_DN15440_c0_g1~~TRINITY_DN15440_c0_g1_i1.p1  ORF type:complete len:305 (-),score=9.83 TRINITY_DN15440_c0_g1_i1:140-1054(-)